MMQTSKFLFAMTVIAGFAGLPTTSQAESAKSNKSSAVGTGTKSQASVDEFEENRRAHMQKSKENNTKKAEE